MNNFTPSSPGPRKETIEFLKKFARLYNPLQEGDASTSMQQRNYTENSPASC